MNRLDEDTSEIIVEYLDVLSTHRLAAVSQGWRRFVRPVACLLTTKEVDSLISEFPSGSVNHETPLVVVQVDSCDEEVHVTSDDSPADESALPPSQLFIDPSLSAVDGLKELVFRSQSHYGHADKGSMARGFLSQGANGELLSLTRSFSTIIDHVSSVPTSSRAHSLRQKCLRWTNPEFEQQIPMYRSSFSQTDVIHADGDVDWIDAVVLQVSEKSVRVDVCYGYELTSWTSCGFLKCDSGWVMLASRGHHHEND